MYLRLLDKASPGDNRVIALDALMFSWKRREFNSQCISPEILYELNICMR